MKFNKIILISSIVASIVLTVNAKTITVNGVGNNKPTKKVVKDLNITIKTPQIQTEATKEDTNTTKVATTKHKSIKKEIKKIKPKPKNKFRLKSPLAAKIFYTKFIKSKKYKKLKIKTAKVYFKKGLDLDNFIIPVSVNTIFNCDKQLLDNGVFNIKKGINVKFNMCKFGKKLIIQNNNRGKLTITKSIGDLVVQGNIKLNKIKLDSLKVLYNSYASINKAKIQKITYEGDVFLRFENSPEIFLENINDRSYVNFMAINSTITLKSKFHYAYVGLFNSELDVKEDLNSEYGSFVSFNSYIKGKYLGISIKGCVYFNNIELNKISGGKDDNVYRNNIIKAKGDSYNTNLRDNIASSNDKTDTQAVFQGLSLSSKNIPSAYINSGIKLTLNDLEKCPNYKKYPDLYKKYFLYDSEGKRRDLNNPTPGQYTGKEVLQEKIKEQDAFDFSM